MSKDYFNDSIRIPFLNRLAENISSRFDDKSILESFDCPSRLSMLASNPSKTENFMAYGNTKIKTLAEQYHREDGTIGTASPHECLEEWSGYRQFLSHSFRQAKYKDVIYDLCTNPTTRALYPTMSKLAQIFRVIPVHTAGVEITFSQLKLIKTRNRNRMNEHSLDSLLRIATEGPPSERVSLTESSTTMGSEKEQKDLCLMLYVINF